MNTLSLSVLTLLLPASVCVWARDGGDFVWRDIAIEGVANGRAEGLRIVISSVESGREGSRCEDSSWIRSSRVPADDFSRNYH